MGAVSQKNDFNRSLEFREVADRISAISSNYSVKVKGYRSPELPLYRALAPLKQTEALGQLKTFLATMEATENSGKKLDTDNCFVWSALSTFGLVPPSDLFDKLKSDRVIEVFSLDGQQIWRNFNFLEFCSYTLEELHCIDLFNRYERDEEKTTECIKIIGELLSGQTPDLIYPNIVPHILKETCSQGRMILNVQHELLCTLKSREGQLAAWLIMSSAKILGMRAQTDRPVFNIVPSPNA